MKIELLAESGYHGQSVDALCTLLLEKMEHGCQGQPLEELVERFFTPSVSNQVLKLIEGERPTLGIVDLTEIASVCHVPIIHILTMIGAMTLWEGISSDDEMGRAFMKMRADHLRQLISGQKEDGDLHKSMSNITDILTRSTVESIKADTQRPTKGMVYSEVEFSMH